MAHPAWEGVVTAEEARASWVMWCSDRGLRPGPGTGMSAALVKAGGRRRLRPLRWEGIALAPPRDSGYRVASAGALGERGIDPTPALEALVGLVSPEALDRAWLRLTGESRHVLCDACGRVTRNVHTRRHVRCD